MEDKTGQPVTGRDVADAIQAVTTSMVRDIGKLPPELAVQLPNIRRCLHELAAIKARPRGKR